MANRLWPELIELLHRGEVPCCEIMIKTGEHLWAVKCEIDLNGWLHLELHKSIHKRYDAISLRPDDIVYVCRATEDQLAAFERDGATAQEVLLS